MEFNFNVIARCNKYNTDSSIEDYVVEDLELQFNYDTAYKFISRFAGTTFKLGEYKVQFKYNAEIKPIGLTLVTPEHLYVVRNYQQVIADVFKGFLQIHTLDKIMDIMDFDFKAGIELQTPDPEDEFALEEDKK